MEKLAHLLSANFQTILIDLPGFGQSDPPASNWGVGEYSKFIIDFLSSINLSSIIYFGHSFSGSLGIYLASHYPSKIKKLILCDSSFKRSGKTSTVTKRLKNFIEKIPLSQNLILLLRKIYYRIFFPNSDLLKYPSLEKNFRKIINEDLTQYLKNINCPVLVLWGEEDRETPKTLAFELKEKIKDARLKIFPNISHNLPITNPEKVYSEIKKFL